MKVTEARTRATGLAAPVAPAAPAPSRRRAVTVRFSGVPGFTRLSSAAAAVLSLSACSTDPIEWQAAAYMAQGPPPRIAASSDAALCSAGTVEHGTLRFRAGWSPVSGVLLVFKSTDAGETWGPPVVADARETGGSRCDRPPPALFVDSSNVFLHVAYHAELPGAPGLYYVHSMDAERLAQTGEGMFEQPFAITFGARPVRTSVASRGDTVIIAYEDPNSERGGIQVAVSSTAGHSFERRMSAGRSAGSEPAVELGAGEVILWWRERAEPRRWLRQQGTFR